MRAGVTGQADAWGEEREREKEDSAEPSCHPRLCSGVSAGA
jgi:hypothetical protein